MIYYRLSDRISKNRPPIFKDDKFRVVRLCLRSFTKALEGVESDIFFMLDRCPGNYLEMIKEIFPRKFEYEFTDYGHYNSALKQYNLADKTDDEVILFVEDDYLWTEGSVKQLINATKELKIASPYNNPDFYTTEPHKSQKIKTKLIDNHKWRTTLSTTMTIGITKNMFKKHRTAFDNWGPSDTPLWTEVNETIWCPIPSLATHFVVGKLAPDIDWAKFYDN